MAQSLWPCLDPFASPYLPCPGSNAQAALGEQGQQHLRHLYSHSSAVEAGCCRWVHGTGMQMLWAAAWAAFKRLQQRGHRGFLCHMLRCNRHLAGLLLNRPLKDMWGLMNHSLQEAHTTNHSNTWFKRHQGYCSCSKPWQPELRLTFPITSHMWDPLGQHHQQSHHNIFLNSTKNNNARMYRWKAVENSQPTSFGPEDEAHWHLLSHICISSWMLSGLTPSIGMYI